MQVYRLDAILRADYLSGIVCGAGMSLALAVFGGDAGLEGESVHAVVVLFGDDSIDLAVELQQGHALELWPDDGEVEMDFLQVRAFLVARVEVLLVDEVRVTGRSAAVSFCVMRR